MGAWIETSTVAAALLLLSVAPYVGAWIETTMKGLYEILTESHPTWVRGLKHECAFLLNLNLGRTLRGCVD